MTAWHYLSHTLHALLTLLKSVGATGVIDLGGRKTLQLGRTVKSDVQEFLILVAAARRTHKATGQPELLVNALVVYQRYQGRLLPGYRVFSRHQLR